MIRTKYGILILIFVSAFFASCESAEPVKEDTPEMITKATLTFTPTSGAPVVGTAIDPDGEGVQDLQVIGTLILNRGTGYRLDIELFNELVSVGEEGYDITREVQRESDEHMFFFGWEGELFDDPAGEGNIVSRSGPVNYSDADGDGLPVGLMTRWTTIDAEGSGQLRVMLKHQPDLKTETSTSSTGETDLDITFDLQIE